MDGLFLFLAIINAIITAVIANHKNYSWGLWFLLGLIFPVVAPIIIIFFRETLTEENAPPSPKTHVKCPECMELVRREAIKCKHCAAKLTPQVYEVGKNEKIEKKQEEDFFEETPDHLKNEIDALTQSLKKYGYDVQKYNPKNKSWLVLGESVRFEQKIHELRSLLRNFEK